MDTVSNALDRPVKSEVFDRFIEALNDRNLVYYAQDWMKSMGYQNMDELHRALSPLLSINDTPFSTSQNVKLVYRCDRGRIYEDWKLSLLGLTYLAFNSPHKSQKISRMQLKIISDYLKQEKNYESIKTVHDDKAFT